tara:strand:+ start:6550 stop:9057 length:2508 start_codon:yes stop_codon:yes gene_type:complete
MKKNIIFCCAILVLTSLSAQSNLNSISKEDVAPIYLKLLPSNSNPSDLRPSDIPSAQVLKQMGFSENEIQEALDFKYSRGKYKNSIQDTLQNNTSLFYATFGDTLNVDTVKYPKAKIFGQDIFRNNELEFFQKAFDAKAPENYIVSSGDEISISVWGYSDLSETLIVDERGYISPKSYGRIYVKGLEFRKMRSMLKSRFSSFLDMKNSSIEIALAYSRVITVNIVGEVYNPGSYTIPAINTAFNALIAAKGPNQIGSVRNIYIKRDGKVIDSLDVYNFLFNPTTNKDIFLEDGDYIFVPPASNLIEVSGAVNRPYTYESKSNDAVEDLIKFAGGYSENAFLDVITLKRKDYNSIKVYDVFKNHLKSTALMNGDEIIVNSISNKLANYVTVKGSIGVEGDYEYIVGEKLLDLLNRAKCIDEKTFLNQAYIIRLDEDRTRSFITVNLDSIINNPNHHSNLLLEEYDIIKVLSVDDFEDNFSVSAIGAVRKSGIYDFGIGMTLKDLLLQAGGLSRYAEGSKIEISRAMDFDIKNNKLVPIRSTVKNIKIDDNLLLSSNAENFVLQPYDQVFVRENPDFIKPANISISGEIKYPGQYSLISKNEKISSVIDRAGGLNQSAYIDGVKMYRRFKTTIEYNNALNIPKSILDSIITDAELSNLYNIELLKREKERYKKLYYDSLIYEVVYFDMNKALKNPNSQHNLTLFEGDSIVIPKTLDVVNITGMLNNIEGNSISVPYVGMRAHYYVNNFAGGYSQDNRKSSTVVTHANGVTKKSINLGLFSISPKVKPGSTIKVIDDYRVKRRKKEDIDYNKHIESVVTKVTALMSLWLLIDRVNGSF